LINWLIFLLSLGLIFSTLILPSRSLFARFLSLLAVMLGATLIVSGALRLVPGDPIDHILGEQAHSTSRELIAQELGLINESGAPLSFVDQYGKFLGHLVNNNLKSFITRRNTLDTVLERLPYTIALGTAAMIVALILGPLLGIMASFFHHRWPDHLLSLFALIGISIPSFFLGPLLLLLFSLHWGLLPISGADNGISSLVLPALSMGTALAAMLARMSRASILEVLSEDFIRTAKAKGLASRLIFFKHALRNALIPVVTLVGLQFGAVLAGAVITEKVFNWPGMGLLLLDSIYQLDMPMVQTCVLFIALVYAVVNMTTDILYGLIDPRISMGKS
jgi:peptide/nickel transport system permease protein